MERPDYRFGTSELQSDTNRLIVPRQLEAVEVVQQGESVFWAYSSAKQAVVVSNRRDLFEEENFEILGQTTVGDNRVTPVSQEALNVLNTGILYFILSPELGSEMCMVVGEDEAQARYKEI